MDAEPLSYPDEIWKPVTDPRFNEPLEASDYGRVRRSGHQYLRGGRPGVAPFWSTKHPRIARVYFRQGYPYVNVVIDGRRRGVAVHILTCTAFHGIRPTERHEAAHWDGEPMNATPDNLRWVLPVENEADKRRHGRVYEGEEQHLAKLTDEAVRFIRGHQDLKRGDLTVLAKKLGVTRHTVSRALHRQTWKHVT